MISYMLYVLVCSNLQLPMRNARQPTAKANITNRHQWHVIECVRCILYYNDYAYMWGTCTNTHTWCVGPLDLVPIMLPNEERGAAECDWVWWGGRRSWLWGEAKYIRCFGRRRCRWYRSIAVVGSRRRYTHTHTHHSGKTSYDVRGSVLRTPADQLIHSHTHT